MVKSLRSVLIVPSLLMLACASTGPGDAVITSPVTEQDAGSEPDAAPAELEDDEDEEPPAEELEGKCGDLVCNVNESCQSCAPDCGRCPVCEEAPSCTGSQAIPSSAMHLESFDNGERALYTSGVDDATGMPLGVALEQTDCIAPELRMRIRQIQIVRDGVSWSAADGGLADLYCVLNASDGKHSEVMITPIQYDIGDDHPPIVMPPEAAMFWGQGMAWQTLDNLTVTYQCFLARSNEGYTKVFDAIQDGAIAAGGVAGPWGWAFGAGGIAAGLISSAIPEAMDETRINVQQTIDASMLLELTNGRRWWIRGQGDAPGIGGIWDWNIEVEAWGCSSARIPPPK